MTEGYERSKDLPRPGFAAGPCLFKDTLQLSAASRGRFEIGDAAMAMNEGLPSLIVDQLGKKFSLRGLRVGILGMAYKADIDDTRDSLSFKLKNLLTLKGADVMCSDEYVKNPTFLKKSELIAHAKVLIIGVPHWSYKTLKVPRGKTIIDPWNILPT
jgi:UDP-N-acetyl-D-mannosaminuronic acid dehydrogenase